MRRWAARREASWDGGRGRGRGRGRRRRRGRGRRGADAGAGAGAQARAGQGGGGAGACGDQAAERQGSGAHVPEGTAGRGRSARFSVDAGLALSLAAPHLRHRHGWAPRPRQDVHRPQDRAVPLVARAQDAGLQRGRVQAQASRQPPAPHLLRSAKRVRQGRAPRRCHRGARRHALVSRRGRRHRHLRRHEQHPRAPRHGGRALRLESVEVVFIESICDDAAIIEANIRDTKARSADYEGVDEEEAVRDFRHRIAHYAQRTATRRSARTRAAS